MPQSVSLMPKRYRNDTATELEALWLNLPIGHSEKSGLAKMNG